MQQKKCEELNRSKKCKIKALNEVWKFEKKIQKPKALT